MASQTEQSEPPHVATIKLQPFRDTQMTAEGALEAGPGLGPVCLGDNEKVIERQQQTQDWNFCFVLFLMLVWELLSAWHYSCHLCHSAPQLFLVRLSRANISSHPTGAHCMKYFCLQVKQQDAGGYKVAKDRCPALAPPAGAWTQNRT